MRNTIDVFEAKRRLERINNKSENKESGKHSDCLKKMSDCLMKMEAIRKNRKENNIMVLDLLREQVEKYPDMRFEQLLLCFLDEIDFYREPSATLEKIELSIKKFEDGKNR